MKSINKVNTSYRHDEEQIDFYGTVNEDGTPHITMLTSLHIYDGDTFIWGEYSAGKSKRNQRVRTKVGFLSVIGGTKAAAGKADWVESQKSGKMLDALNQIPEFRYNNVNGYSPAHILKKKAFEEIQFDLDGIKQASADTAGVLEKVGAGNKPEAVNVLTRQYFDAEQGFKVLAYIDKDGYPKLLAVPQARLTQTNRLVFSEEYDKLLKSLPEGTPIAVYAIVYPSMCAVLVSGKLQRTEVNAKKYGVMDIETVYNPMLPVAGQIFPPEEIKPVREFKDTIFEYNV